MNWLVFYGTLTTTVRADSEHDAWFCFIDALRPPRPQFGHFVFPTREEVTIRRPRASDRSWIEDSGDPNFLALLDGPVDA